MRQILLGALAFGLAFCFDWVSWLRIRRLKPLLGLAAAATLAVALLWTLATPGHFHWPRWTPLIGWPLLALSTLLLAYSLFIELPLATTYVRQGSASTLVRTGTYALVRHPGVLWLWLWLGAWVLVSRGRLMLVAAIVWSLLDTVYVWLQEVTLLPRMFPGYAAYQKETPMLLPTRQSLIRCLRTLPGRSQASPP